MALRDPSGCRLVSRTSRSALFMATGAAGQALVIAVGFITTPIQLRYVGDERSGRSGRRPTGSDTLVCCSSGSAGLSWHCSPAPLGLTIGPQSWPECGPACGLASHWPA